ncbi:cytosine permease [Wukongibacter baidiensis]|uniref:purine-cytosine permease family protein n=1 Tax=Wukongibacter baidiensis TaxID=1723361 RepID=UPI003D7FD2D6
MSTEKTTKVKSGDEPLKSVPLDQRQHWLTPAMIFGGLEFCIPVLMVGSMLVGAFGIKKIFPVLFVAFICVQWAGNALSGYIGAKTGRTSSVVARSGFGADQARFIIAIVIFIACMGWWAVQTSVAGNAICAMLNIDYANNWGVWALITTIVGLVFAIPSIIGYASMKWTDYIAVPAGLLLCIFGIYLAFTNFGWDTIRNFQPQAQSMTFLGAVSLVVSLNVSQWVIAADYTRYAKPTIKDNILIPIGIIGIGFPLMYVGAVMAVGQGTADIVQVMSSLGFPFWGFIVLWLSTWTSQLVNNYTMGLSFSNLLNVSSSKGRSILTLIGTIISIGLALSGILNHFMDFLYLTALCYPSMAGVIFVDFFIRNKEWQDNKGWNWMATIAFVSGIIVGYITTYVSPMGLPAVQSLIVTGAVYYGAMKIKAQISPDHFTPESFKVKEV